MPTGPIRLRLLPFKVLMHLLYSKHEWIRPVGRQQVEVDVGPMTRSLRISHSRLGEYLQWLQSMGLIGDIDCTKKGCRTVTLKPPPNLETASV